MTPAPTIPRGVDQRIQRRENNNFDLLRLLAAAQVIYLHSVFFLDRDERGFLPLVDFVASVFPGVPIFFVISGFLVSQSYERSHGIRDYARKRALRIFPALWICFAVTLALLGGFFWLERFTDLGVRVGGESFLLSWSFPVWAVGQLTAGQFYVPQNLAGFGVGQTNPSLWTIPVEIGFYVFVPVIYWLIIGRFRTSVSSVALGVAAMVSFGLWYFSAFLALGTEAGRPQLAPDMTNVPAAVTLLLQTPLPHLYWFLIGVLLWRNFDTIERVLRDRVIVWTAAYAVFAYAPIWLDARSIRVTIVYQLVRALLLGLWALSFAFSFRGASHSVLRGWDLSYGLYLFHMLVINTFVELGFGGNTESILLVYVVTALLAAASWKLVERPALSRRRRASELASSRNAVDQRVAESST